MSGYLSDHPTLADAFGREKLVREVARRVQTCTPPHVIGVYGDWGSGKTSFLRALQVHLSGEWDKYDPDDIKAHLKNRPEHDDIRNPGDEFRAFRRLAKDSEGYPVIWFDAWRYQTESAPIVALLHEMRRHFSPGAKLGQFVKKTGTIAAQSALLAFDSLAKEIELIAPGAGFIGKAVGNASKVAESYERETFSTPLTTNQIRDQLNYAISTLLKNLDWKAIAHRFKAALGRSASSTKRDRLTIIIDDLDRCESAVALRLLEGIKVFLSLDNCVFVLGVNPRRLVEHIAEAYYRDSKDFASIEQCRYRAQDYLDKIINVHYSFGLPSNLAEIMKRLLPDFTVQVEGETMRRSMIEDVRKYLGESHFLPPNPRRVTAFINTLSRYQEVRFPKVPDAKLLIAFAYLNQFHPDLVRKLQWHVGYEEAFVKWCTDQTIGDTYLFDGVAVPLGPEQASRPSKEGLLPNYAERFRDPIYDNVLHVRTLIADWRNGQPTDELLDLRAAFAPYILLS
jgi:hypothetical protein